MENFMEGVAVPQAAGGQYMKLVAGENTFRPCSKIVSGYEYWEDMPDGTRKPFRYVTKPAGKNTKSFWALAVLQGGQVKILAITQVTIMRALQQLWTNPKWGDPTGFEVTITKAGSTKEDTKYTVIPQPHTKKTAEEVKALQDAKVDLEALFRGDDPFATKVTPLI